MIWGCHAGVAQLVERNLAKVEVESSRLFSRSNFRGQHIKMLSFFTGKFEACIGSLNMMRWFG